MRRGKDELLEGREWQTINLKNAITLYFPSLQITFISTS